MGVGVELLHPRTHIRMGLLIHFLFRGMPKPLNTVAFFNILFTVFLPITHAHFEELTFKFTFKLLFLHQKINTNLFDYKLAGTSLMVDSSERFLNILRVLESGKAMANLKHMMKKVLLQLN